MHWKKTPIFILSKDRPRCLKTMIARLTKERLTNIFICDTGSTYPPMLDYLSKIRLPVIRLVPRDDHAPKFVLWDRDVIKTTGQENKHFVYTDCDTVPDENCPDDWLRYLYRLLRKYHTFRKAGLGLKLADIPHCYAHRSKVLAHEHRFWTKSLEPHVFDSELDTTLALYLPDTPHTYRAIRTGGKYLVRHLPWYYDSANLPDEERYYMEHLHPKASFWTRRDKK